MTQRYNVTVIARWQGGLHALGWCRHAQNPQGLVCTWPPHELGCYMQSGHYALDTEVRLH